MCVSVCMCVYICMQCSVDMFRYPSAIKSSSVGMLAMAVKLKMEWASCN